MSEYQYYEFVAIDRPLSKAELEEVRKLSSRAEITPTSFVNEYHFGDFRGHPRKLIEKYYDAHLYYANWGTRRLILRMPCGAIDRAMVEQYAVMDVLEIWSTPKHVCVEFAFNTEDYDDYWEQTVDSFVGLRDELLRGDFRALYLAWLHAAEFELVEQDGSEPPVPPGLAKLTDAQDALREMLLVPAGLIAAAAEGHDGNVPVDTSAEEARTWIARLPQHKKDELLVQLLLGDTPRVRGEALSNFQQSRQRKIVPPSKGERRTAGELVAKRDAFQAIIERRNAIEEQARADKAKNVILKKARGQEASLFKKADELIDAHNAGFAITEAVTHLRLLYELAKTDGWLPKFDQQLAGLRNKYANRKALWKHYEAALKQDVKEYK